jgi:hypothetical protein
MKKTSTVISTESNRYSKWYNLFVKLSDEAVKQSESGYCIEVDEYAILDFFNICEEMGNPVPKTYPKNASKSPHANFAREVFKAWNGVAGFRAAYMGDLPEPCLEDAIDLESMLIRLSATKVLRKAENFPNTRTFSDKTRKDTEYLINRIKNVCFKENHPQREDFMALINLSANSLRDKAEREALGFNKNRLHPDHLMDEILVNLRLIHQVLPVILQKLGIEKFQIDHAALRPEIENF